MGMMYGVIRFFVRAALSISGCHIQTNEKSFFLRKGPLILASNHPNSFFDAIILASRMNQKVHFIAIGEMTDKFIFRRIMKMLQIIPVYNLHGKSGNQERNEQSITLCLDVLLNKGIVLIFPEAVSENNWLLRPVKKLTARIALAAFQHPEMQSELQILPVCLNYNSYSRHGKTVLIRTGEAIVFPLMAGGTESEKMNAFNESLKDRLSAAMLQTENKEDMLQMLISNCTLSNSFELKILQDKLNESGNQTSISKLKKPGYLVTRSQGLLKSLIVVLSLAIPAALGWVLHIVIYYPVKFFVERTTSKSVYHDSVLFAILFLVYPLYWIVLNIAGYLFLRNIWLQIFCLCLPLLAWTVISWNESWQRVRNYFILSRHERSQLANYFK